MPSASLGDLLVRLGVDTSQFSRDIDTAAGKVAAFGSKLTTAGMGLTKMTAPLAGLAIGSVALAGKLEQTEIAFTNMLGSGEAATKMMEDLRDFAAATPFEFQGLTTATQKLLAFGFEGDKIIPMLTSIGDAVAAIGGGEFEIQRVTTALGQMQAKGKVSAQEMMQLAELGIPAWKLLAESIGVSIPEAMKLAEKGAIDAQTGINAIVTGMAEQFGGMMEQQSQTLLGRWSTFKDNAKAALADLGSALLPIAGQILTFFTGLIEHLGRATEWFKQLPAPVQTTIVAVLGLATALGPVLVVLGTIVSSGAALVPVFTAIAGAIAGISAPVVIAVAGIGLLVAAFVTAYRESEDFRDAVNGAFESVLETVRPILSELRDTVTAVLGYIRSAWAEWGDEIMTVIVPLFKAAIAQIETTLRVVGAVILTILNVIQGDWRAAWENISSIGPIMVEGMKSILVNLFTGLKNAIVEIIKGLWRESVDSFTEGLAATQKAVEDHIPKILQPWRYFQDELVGNSIIPDTVAAVGENLSQMATDAISTGADMADGFVGEMGRMSTQTIGVFEQLVLGMRRALAEGVNAVNNFAVGVTNAVSNLDLSAGVRSFENLATQGRNALSGLAQAGLGALSTALDQAKNKLTETGNTAATTFSSGAASGQSAAEKMAEKVRDMTDALEEERDKLGMTTREILEYDLAQQNATTSEIAAALALRDQIDAFEKAQKAAEDNADAVADLTKELETQAIRSGAVTEKTWLQRAAELELTDAQRIRIETLGNLNDQMDFQKLVLAEVEKNNKEAQKAEEEHTKSIAEAQGRIKDYLGDITDRFLPEWAKGWEKHWQFAKDIFATFGLDLGGIVDSIMGMFDGFLSGLGGWLGRLGKWAGEALGIFSSVASGAAVATGASIAGGTIGTGAAGGAISTALAGIGGGTSTGVAGAAGGAAAAGGGGLLGTLGAAAVVPLVTLGAVGLGNLLEGLFGENKIDPMVEYRRRAAAEQEWNDLLARDSTLYSGGTAPTTVVLEMDGYRVGKVVFENGVAAARAMTGMNEV